jgi:hypothetical protein
LDIVTVLLHPLSRPDLPTSTSKSNIARRS